MDSDADGVMADVVFNDSVAILEGPPQEKISGQRDIPPLPGVGYERKMEKADGKATSKAT